MSENEIAAMSDRVSYAAAAVAIAITCILLFISVRRQRYSWMPLYVLLLLIHPAWTLSSTTSDLGAAKRFLAIACSSVIAVILFCQVFWPNLRKEIFLFRLCLICWCAYLIAWPLDVLLARYETVTGLDGSLGAQMLSSFLATEKDMFFVAIAVALVYGIVCLISRVRSRTQRTSEMGSDSLNAKNRWPSGLSGRILALVAALLLLTLVALSVVSRTFAFGANPLFYIVALVWAAILLVAIIRSARYQSDVS